MDWFRAVILSKEALVMDFEIRNEHERLVVEQALLMYREVQAAGEAAEHGQGMARLEDAVLDAGRRQMRLVIEQALRSRAAAQKGGAVARPASASPGSKASRPRR